MRYGISSMDSGCDYTEFNTLEECKNWILSNAFKLERDGAKYIQIVNADNPDEIVFYDNILWNDGVSNITEIVKKIG